MPLLLKIRKAKWYKNDNVPWLPENEIQADAVGDLRTTDNALSVWYILDRKENLEQVITALASTRDTISNLDYALFEDYVIAELGIRMKNTAGTTPAPNANSWHRDLIELTASKLINLANAIMAEAEKSRFSRMAIRELIRNAVDHNKIELARLKPGIRSELG
jgi:hypothetical protein